MQNEEIIKAIDEQIEHLRQARALLTGDNSSPEVARRGPGRPKGSTSATRSTSAPVAKKATKRTLSAEGKARIAAAQKARWANQNKAQKPTKATGKKAPGKKAAAAGRKRAYTRKSTNPRSSQTANEAAATPVDEQS